MKLYEISAKMTAAIKALEEAETEQQYYQAEVELAAVDAEREEKLEACVAFLKNTRGEADAIEAEIARLAAKLEGVKARAERVEEYIGAAIGAGNKWTNGVHSIGWRRAEAVKILDKDAIPSAYLREKLSYEPDKAQIKKDIECGAQIPGAIIEVRQHLQVK